jgi:hypothetical protein
VRDLSSGRGGVGLGACRLLQQDGRMAGDMLVLGGVTVTQVWSPTLCRTINPTITNAVITDSIITDQVAAGD